MKKKYRVTVTAVIQRTLRVSVPENSEDPECEAEQAARRQLEKLIGMELNDVEDCCVEEVKE